MEEEGGDDSEMIDAMDGWDSDQDDGTTTPSTTAGGTEAGKTEVVSVNAS